ncbi:hypothetical protein TPA0910_41590 [Streptomyces hygroscopicus subsp. sporocinereus]|uniref:Uncharacterized protein n=1 Tax=Streptomyces hygroscopicus TaxID=1912 RepID=A0ABQ3U284_STRHY|nr:hypothetical protein TPA0910_41590 [Streptomyces hygroscopicus]
MGTGAAGPHPRAAARGVRTAVAQPRNGGELGSGRGELTVRKMGWWRSGRRRDRAVVGVPQQVTGTGTLLLASDRGSDV